MTHLTTHSSFCIHTYTMTVFTILLLLLTIVFLIIITLIFYLARRNRNYWKIRNVPHLKPTFLFGNYADYILLKRDIGTTTQKLCQNFPNEPYFGAMYGTEPTLIIQDPDLIKLVTTKDFYYFSSREVSAYTHNEVFTKNLFFTYGDRWKVIRQNFTPLFSSSKMRKMFHLIAKCSNVFETLLEEEAKISTNVDIRSLMARYTMDCIGSCMFGIETNVMGKDVDKNPFRKMGDMLFETTTIRGLSLITRAIWPAVFYGLGLKVFPTDLDKFFNKLLINVFKGRDNKPSSRNDFIDLMLSLKQKQYITGDSLANMKTNSGVKVSLEADDELLVAQCLSFFAAGFETSATTLTFTLYELAKCEEAQNKAVEEVDAFLRRHNKELTHDCVTELPFVEACIDEALRMYPVLGVITREVLEEYTLPSGVVLDKGVRVHLPMYHLHYNPDYFPEPEKFMPERFLPENKHNIRPYTYIPFGEGPRICIGMRFAKMQMLAGMVSFLRMCRVRLAPGTPGTPGTPRTLRFEPRALVTQSTPGIRLQLLPRNCH